MFEFNNSKLFTNTDRKKIIQDFKARDFDKDGIVSAKDQEAYEENIFDPQKASTYIQTTKSRFEFDKYAKRLEQEEGKPYVPFNERKLDLAKLDLLLKQDVRKGTRDNSIFHTS